MEVKKFVRDSKAEVVKNANGILTLRLMGSSFGSPAKKDFYDEYFTPRADFGDAFFKTRYSTYDHLPPPWAANPFSSRVLKTEPIGKATLDEISEAGRWYLVELSKSQEYHEYFIKLAELGLLGASTQCLPGSKTMMPDGEITAWFETEIALTVQPADPDTLGNVNDMAKTFKIPMWDDIKSSLEERVVSDALAASDADEKDAGKKDDDDKTQETVITINTDDLSIDVKTAVELAVAASLEAPLAVIDTVVETLVKSVGVLEIFMENEAFNKFIVEFSPTMAEHIRQLKASSYLLATVGKTNGKGGASKPPGAKDKDVSAADDKSGSSDKDEDNKHTERLMGGSASKLPTTAPGKRFR